MARKYNWRSFAEARKFVRSLKLSSNQEWEKFCKSGKKPDDIPSTVSKTYKDEWDSWGDFLGTGRIQNQQKTWRSFNEARKFARSLKFQYWNQWRKYAKSDNRPKNIPNDPSSVYKKEWTSWPDFLGTNEKLSKNRNWRSFTQARKFVHGLGLKDRSEWTKYYKSDNRPLNIPALPSRTYKDEWDSWGDFLGTGRTASFNKKFRSYNDARKFARSLKLKNEKEWKEYCKSGKKPDDIPVSPSRTYKDEYNNLADWLGIDGKFSRNKTWRSFNEARKWAQKSGAKTRNDWMKKYHAKKIPNDIPPYPNQIYKKEWVGMGDWLGTGNKIKKDFWSFEKAREYVRKLKLRTVKEWIVFRKSNKRPDYIPSSPNRVYKDEFVSMGDWLGTGTISGQEKFSNYLPWKEAKPIYRRLARENDLIGRSDWNRFVKKNKKLLNDLRIPASPWRTYSKERVWSKMKDD